MIDEIIKIAKKAGKEILQIYHSNDFSVKIKDDNSPLTKADLISNDIIIKELTQKSNYPILSEEMLIDYETRKHWDTFWLIDPLDGTKDFIARSGHFTVNIALIENRMPVLGIIYIPAMDLLYWAEKGCGAFKDGQRIYNNSNRTDLIASDSIFHSSQQTKDFLQKNSITNIKYFGSSLKYCKLAEGEIDIYPRFNGTKEWDTAAGQIILAESGCKIVDVITKKDIIYNKPCISNNFFIASRDNLYFL
jgi:3'(2'), 5'-bisphosphate nucleotidase